MNVANHIDLAARDVPSKTAVVDPQRSLTYEELAEETNAVANALGELGIEAGDRIAMYLPNSVAFVTSYFGAVKHGAIPVPINMRLQQEGIEYVVADAGARAVVTTGQFEDLFTDMTIDELEHLVVIEGSEGHDDGSLVEAADTEFDVHPCKGDELLGLMYTSGTTGRPKGVKQTHRNMETNSHAMNISMGWSSSDHLEVGEGPTQSESMEVVDDFTEGLAGDPNVPQARVFGVGLDLDEVVDLLADARLVPLVLFLVLGEFAFEAFVFGFEAFDPRLQLGLTFTVVVHRFAPGS